MYLGKAMKSMVGFAQSAFTTESYNILHTDSKSQIYAYIDSTPMKKAHLTNEKPTQISVISEGHIRSSQSI